MVLLLSLFGCREKGVSIYPVEGEVVWSDGRPAQELVRGTVSLRGGHGINPKAEIQSDGTFKLHTRGLGEGVPAGEYSAVVMPPETLSNAPKKSLIDRLYKSHKTSGLKVVVEPGENYVKLEVKRPGAQRN